MSVNLYGEYVYTVDDVVEELFTVGQNYGIFDVYPNYLETKGGYELAPYKNTSWLRQQPGFYFIYRNEDLQYIGVAEGTTVGDRINKCVKEIRNESHPTERHSGGYRWRCWYGQDNFEGLRTMIIPYNYESDYSMKHIESRMIQMYNPRMNKRRSLYV